MIDYPMPKTDAEWQALFLAMRMIEAGAMMASPYDDRRWVGEMAQTGAMWQRG